MRRISRVRRSSAARAMLAETILRPEHLVVPLFVRSDIDAPLAIESLPGHSQFGVQHLPTWIEGVNASGVRSTLLFGIPAAKDESGSSAWSDDGPVPMAIREIKSRVHDMLVIADVCLCEYTTHGHCGVPDRRNGIDTRATLPLLAKAAVSYAQAGADVVAPSAMVDGQVAAIRHALDSEGFADVAILSYSSKFASSLYGPFRDAVGTSLQVGDRQSYQLPVTNIREALRESAQDAAEGADMLMVKPAGSYLDVVSRIRRRSNLPIAAFQVSGEYAMIKAASDRGWIDERRAVLESLYCIRRAGADVIITYFALEAARWLAEACAERNIRT